MAQIIIVVVLFAGAAFYLGSLLFRAFKPAKNGCAGECKCDTKVQVTPRP